MPVLPDIPAQQAMQTAPLPYQSPDAGTLVARAVQEGMGRVASTFTEMVAHQARVKQSQDISNISTTAALDLAKITDESRNDPDPASAGERFRARVEAWHQGVLDKIEDPGTRVAVQRHLAPHLQSSYTQALRQFGHAQSENARTQLAANSSDQQKLIAAAPDDAAVMNAVNLARDTINNAARDGTIAPAAAGPMLSYTLRQALFLKSTSDAPGARRLLDQFRGSMTAQDLIAVEGHFRVGDIDAQGAAIAARNVSLAGSSSIDPAGFDARFQRIIGAESNGQQFDASGAPLTSSKGATGVAQVMPGTGPEAARLAGLPWDEARFKTDRTYNAALGRAYYQNLEKTYGNAVLAAAAYNAGPGRVDQWITTIGDPRSGAVSDAEFVAAIPFAETRAYVRKVQALTGEAAPVSRADALAAVLKETEGNPQLQAAAIKHANQMLAVEQARWAEAQRADLIQKRGMQAAQEEAINRITTQALIDPTRIDIVRDIANNPFLTGEQKWQMTRNVSAQMQRDDGTDSKTYGPGFWKFYQAIHRPEGDPERITDPSALYAFGGPGGQLTLAGIDKLVGEIKGRRTPEGEAEGLMKKQFLENARKQISGSNELLHIRDPKGDDLYLRFLAQVLPAYDEARRGGAAPVRLLNPDSPDYLGKAIGGFKRPMAEWMRDLATSDALAGTPDATPAATAAKGAEPDLTTKEGILAAYKAGKLARDEAIRRIIQGGFFPASPPTVPINP